jgi:hypothetical protein
MYMSMFPRRASSWLFRCRYTGGAEMFAQAANKRTAEAAGEDRGDKVARSSQTGGRDMQLLLCDVLQEVRHLKGSNYRCWMFDVADVKSIVECVKIAGDNYHKKKPLVSAGMDWGWEFGGSGEVSSRVFILF